MWCWKGATLCMYIFKSTASPHSYPSAEITARRQLSFFYSNCVIEAHPMVLLLSKDKWHDEHVTLGLLLGHYLSCEEIAFLCLYVFHALHFSPVSHETTDHQSIWRDGSIAEPRDVISCVPCSFIDVLPRLHIWPWGWTATLMQALFWCSLLLTFSPMITNFNSWWARGKGLQWGPQLRTAMRIFRLCYQNINSDHSLIENTYSKKSKKVIFDHGVHGTPSFVRDYFLRRRPHYP